ncbi:hypothetical protein M433DRAFT_131558 [Acidomyces richmondensis BFW]|nr:MAG: hypothetical protein FE78DRAFT_83639 [Acidomyces sp. 'richmondensis']KYG49065.1 hypothetical protein M433DRAFT_131558 [Acidomyces richmondensis BFW]
MALNPHQKNKVDLSQLTEEEQKVFRLYGKLPNKKDLLQKKLQERKYFDSGDYAMSKAGKSDAGLVGGLGKEHPSPDTIPHLSQAQSHGSTSSTSSNPGSSSGGAERGSISGAPGLHPSTSHTVPAGSPVKEPSVLARGVSVDEQDLDDIENPDEVGGEEKKGMPIRQ